MFSHAFVDWDDTLYNKTALAADISNIFAKYGVSQEDISKTYLQSLCTVAPHQYDYSFGEHTKFLRELGYKLPNIVEEELNSLFFKDYLFSDSILFLQFLKNISEKVILLSAGDKNFQKNKIKNSKVADNFDEVIILDGGKEKYLVDNYKEGNIFFINDNLRENFAVKQGVPRALVITKLNTARYSATEASQIGLPYFETLTEIKQYVEQQVK